MTKIFPKLSMTLVSLILPLLLASNASATTQFFNSISENYKETEKNTELIPVLKDVCDKNPNLPGC